MRIWVAAAVIAIPAIGLAASVGAMPSPPSPAVPAPSSTTSTTEVAPAVATTTTTTTTTTTSAPTESPAQPVPVEPVSATPTRPIHDGVPQGAAGQSEADAVTIADDGFGYPVETGPAEVRRMGRPYDTTDLDEVCVAKPWLCDDSYAH